MSAFSVLKFSTVDGAWQMEDALLDLQKRQIIEVQDAALVSWPQGRKSPRTVHLDSLGGPSALAEAFWGMLFGLVFFVPFFGMAVSAAIGTLDRKFGDYGIDEAFIRQTSTAVTEGTSALFMLTKGSVRGKVVAALKDQSFELISTNLPKEKEAELRATFGTI